MTEIKSVKIQSLVESQIPEFLNEDYPLFKEFLQQYYISQEYQTGIVDLSNNLNKYKSIENFNDETFYTTKVPCIVLSNILAFDDTINVNHTNGFPSKYGLLKINDEIITYTGKTSTSFTGCIRGFSGVDSLSQSNNVEFLNFTSTNAAEHAENSTVNNLSLIFFEKIFEKFKTQFLPGFEGREFYSGINLQTILSRAKDFYISKGTDASFKILFRVLFGNEIDVIKPKDYLLRPSDIKSFVTKNILVEKVSGGDPVELRGKSLFQTISGVGTASAAIYNVEYRPLQGKNLYEISLDDTSFILNFNVTKKTNVSESVSAGSSSILVDSTIGFTTSILTVYPTELSNPIEIQYSDKTTNQFLGVTGLTSNLQYNDVVLEKNLLYSHLDDGSLIEFRLINIISDIDYSKTKKIRVGDKISLLTFGTDLNDNVQLNSWIYNIPTSHDISFKEKITGSLDEYVFNTYDDVKFIIGETVVFTNTNDINDISISIQVTDYNFSSKEVRVKTNTNISNKNVLTKTIQKGSSSNFSEISILPAGVQNTYSDYDFNNFFVTSSGIPNYPITSQIDQYNVQAGVGSIFTTTTHNLQTGEKIRYISSPGSGISSSYYFIKRINSNQFYLSFNQSDLYKGSYISGISSSADYIIKEGYYNSNTNDRKQLNHQKLLKKFNLKQKENIFDYNQDKSTTDRAIGILINGVELYSPTVLNESIYYGKLDSVFVEKGGSGYDAINPPTLVVSDDTGTGAIVTPNISGSVQEIKISSPGIGYQTKPKITIEGGNGSGAVLEPNLVKARIISPFKGDSVGVNFSTDIITFTGNHNFNDGEQVIYSSNGNNSITYRDTNPFTAGYVDSALSSDAVYFVGIVTSNQIKLYKNLNDALNKTNNIDIVGISSGIHSFKTLNSKNTINKVYVKNSGSGYSNKSITISSGINTYDNYITANRHNFNNKDIIIYSYTNNPIGGLSTTTQYFVTVIDENNFKLSDAGIGTLFTDSNYINKRYVNLTGITSITDSHTFSYPPITIKIEALPGIAQTSVVQPVLQPIVTGPIESVFVQNSGVGYGCTNIINFHRKPDIEISSISEAILKPSITNGTIVDVQILNYGNGYGNDVDIVITDVNGNGKYADIIPIIQNGKLSSVQILNGGIGYDNNTQLTLQRRGSGVLFGSNVYEWKINQVAKNTLSDDDGYIVPNINEDLGLKFVHFYPPASLKTKVKDGIEDNYPILGWAYDGNPIYGSNIKDGSSYRPVKSSYKLLKETNPQLRPPNYVDGFFVQDYQYSYSVGDLDEYNGKYLPNSPKFPNGTYAYFSTNTYPYVIGNKFKNNPILKNYDDQFNQNINFKNIDIVRNTSPYFINSNQSSYGLLNSVDKKYKQDFIVTKTLSSGINSITIYDSGNDYKVNDNLNFNNEFTEGTGASAVVSRVKGKDISNIVVGISTFNDVVFYNKSNKVFGVTGTPHNLLDQDQVLVLSISNSNYKNLEGYKTINVKQKTVGLTSSLLSQSLTGVSTFISVTDISGFEINDYIQIDSEVLKITNILSEKSSFIVNRYDSFSGVHTAGISSVSLLPTKFNFIQENITSSSYKNDVIYFNPSNSVGVGTSGTNYFVSGIGVTNIFVPSRSIYIPNHTFYTGQQLVYSTGLSNQGLVVSNTGTGTTFRLQDGQTVYALNFGVDFVGLSTLGFTTSSGIGTQLNSLYFGDNYNVGYSHSLTTNYSLIQGRVENYSVNVSTAQTHELTTGDKVIFNLFPNKNETITFRYDPIIRKITTEKIAFDSSTGINTSNSTVNIPNNSFVTGDKVVYYSDGNSPVGGLSDNLIYFILKENPDNISLCNFGYDANVGISTVLLTSSGVGTHYFAKINPQINATQGNTINFDTSDSSLNNMQLVLYSDRNFTKELETYNYDNLILTTQTISYPNQIYYNFIAKDFGSNDQKQISSDSEVLNSNQIKLNKSVYNKEYSIIGIGSTSFKFDLTKKPETTSYTSTSGITSIFYDTDSLNAKGPISKIKINASGKGYKKLPKITSITSGIGTDSILRADSNNLGKIDLLERVKDGFDYPTDVTLNPYLGVPAVAQIKDISRVDYVGVITGGKNYNYPPILKVIGNDNIKLSASLQGQSVASVSIVQNTNNLSAPLDIIATNNSNGYDINDIKISGNDVTLELINVDNQIYPLFSNTYGSSNVEFPFSIGDKIFIERCRIFDEYDTGGNPIIRNNYNSKDYNYQSFTVTGISTINYTVTYNASGISTNFGIYDIRFGPGYVVNQKDIAKFQMFIVDDLSYTSGESVFGYDNSGNNIFSATVMENGWDNDINEIRMINCKGDLRVGNKLYGKNSKLNGTVKNINQFKLKTTLGVSRDKINNFSDPVGITNDYLQRISDNNYYQKFSYAIKSQISYDKWKEPVKSLVHPSGYKEFSDLNVIGIPTDGPVNIGIAKSSNMIVSTASSLSLLVEIDNLASFNTRNNFATAIDDNIFEDGSVESVVLDGVDLTPYLLCNTNKVLQINDISDQFTGTKTYTSIATTSVTFDSLYPFNLGVSTSGLQIGDYIGFSTLLRDPIDTTIISIGINSIGIGTFYGHKVISGITTQTLTFNRLLPGNSIVGLSSFKLTNSIGTSFYPLFYREFDSSNSITTSVNLSSQYFSIPNHNFQTGQNIIYSYGNNTPIGIATTSILESSVIVQKTSGNIPYLSVASTDSSIIMEVSGGGYIGSAIYENGYNVAISTTISGTSAVIPSSASKNVFYGFGNPFPQKSTSGIGTNAKFSVFIVYDGTGTPISTSLVLNNGGNYYGIGNTVSISGTYIGGTTPTNDLSFKVSKIANTGISTQSNQSYSNIPGTSVTGFGTGAKFNVSRDSSGIINSISIAYGGVGYALTDNISIAGTYVGGSTSLDNVYITPTVLGSNKLPKNLYVKKIDNNNFRVSGLNTTTENVLYLTSVGVGSHSFALKDPNPSVLIQLDNIIQSPVYRRNLYTTLSSNVGISSTTIYVSSGISSISGFDFLQIDDEYLKIVNVGIGSTNSIDVERGFLGSIANTHNSGSAVTVVRGDFNIVNDVIYFTQPPYGKITYGQSSNNTGFTTSLSITSSFEGRAFSRKFDAISKPNDKNLILDDISTQFTGRSTPIGIFTGSLDANYPSSILGIDTSLFALGDVINVQYSNNLLLPLNTIINSIGIGSITIVPNHNNIIGIATTTFTVIRDNFILKSNNQNVVGLYTNSNTILNSVSNINNNPIILINNVSQTSGKDFIIDTPGNNTIKFISGVPNAGKIVRVAITTGYGYQPLVGASATVSVSAAGTISNVYLTGYGSGYVIAPNISIASTVGTGASITATVGSGGTITSLSIANPGSGYTNTSLPIVSVEIPRSYSNLNLTYTGGSSGVGTDAKVSVVVGNGSSIIGFNLDNPGYGYKVGEILKVSGITTNPTVGAGFSEFRLTVQEVLTDKFSGYYPGQFVQFDDISNYFDGVKTKFTLTVTENGITDVFAFRVSDGSDLDPNKNIFIFIDDILQSPNYSYSVLTNLSNVKKQNYSYTVQNSRIIFQEAPKKGSKCNILFYRGSDLDVEQIDPPKTIKPGDNIKIKNDLYDQTIRSQFDRVVKKIVTYDQLDTFTYNSFGINASVFRPMDWTKQTTDTIINGVLYSKSRPDLKSRIIPSAQIIKQVLPSDSSIYVDNAYPLFVDIDSNKGLTQTLRNVEIIENREISPAIGTAIVSSGSTISSVVVSFAGSGYINNTSPNVIIPQSRIYKKDITYNWSGTVGLTTSYEFKSISYGNIFVSVGTSSLVGTSVNGINWKNSTLGYGTTISFNAINVSPSNVYVAVGNTGTIINSVGIGTTISSWKKLNLLTATQDILNNITYSSNSFVGTFNDVVYSSSKDTWVVVGSSGAIFSAVGVGSTNFIQSQSSPNTLNSITTNENQFVGVGNNGQLVTSDNGLIWTNSSIISSINLNKVIWDGTKYIVVGNSGYIATSTNGTSWTTITSNISDNLKNIKYYENVYYALSDSGTLYFSFDLTNWINRSTNQSNKINDIIYNSSLALTSAVGSSGTAIYATPTYNKASATSNVVNGQVSSVNITNGGFGYPQNYNLPVLFESDTTKNEMIYSISAQGDYGTITNVSVANSTISFTLKSDSYPIGIGYSSLNSFGINYSQISIGDYFIISNSNCICGHALTGITTSLGGLSNYPASKVGTATTYLDGVYRAERVSADVNSGIVTVGCNFAPGPSGYPINVSVGVNTFYGRYSWSKIYNYFNRSNFKPKTFTLNVDNGLIGISSGPTVYRTRGII